MSTLPPIEFAEWRTSIENDDLHLLDVVYKDGGGAFEFFTLGFGVDIPPNRTMSKDLVARFFSADQKAIYRISCSPIAYRVLDEHGLVELWSAAAEQGGRPGQATFKVRNHGWTRESVLSFFNGAQDGYSYVIATGWDCLELVCFDPPEIVKEQDVPSRPAKDPADCQPPFL
jgi:hypothetical protein